MVPVAVDPFVGLVRRWAVDWLAAADPAVCEEILAPEYSLLIGGYLLDGRTDYVPATVAQLERFPGLGVTVHHLIASTDGVAVRLSEHGASAKLGFRPAGWGAVALFQWDGERLSGCFAEEDYYSRRRQLAVGGACDPIERPAPAPWTTPPGDPDPAAEDVVRRWLSRGDFAGADVDDSWLGHDASVALDDVSVDVNHLFSAGPEVAFHAHLTGTYAGGLDGLDEARGREVTLHAAGIVEVSDDAVAGGFVVRDRLGLSRALA